MKRITAVIITLVILVSFAGCGEKYDFDYSGVVVDEPLMFDPSNASVNGISLGMSAEEIINSGIFSEGSLTFHEKGENISYDDDGNIVWESPEQLFYNDTEFTDIKICGESADIEIQFSDGYADFLSIGAVIDNHQADTVKEAESEIYRIMGEPNVIAVSDDGRNVTWHYLVKDGKAVEGIYDPEDDEAMYDIWVNTDYDYHLYVSLRSCADKPSGEYDMYPTLGGVYISLITKDRAVKNLS